MRIGIQTWGSDGDIRPLIALGGGLRAAGHGVKIAVTSVDNKDYSQLCEALDLGYIKVPEQTALDGPDLVRKIEGKSNIGFLKVVLRELFYPYQEDMYRAALSLAQSSDVLISHFIAHPMKAAALKTATPFISVTLYPGFVPTAFAAPPGLPNLGRWLNPLGWKLARTALDLVLKKDIQRFWTDKALPPFSHVLRDAWQSDTLNLLGVSSMLCSQQPDWGAQYRICGFFAIPDEAEPWPKPAGLRDFLDEGEPPVYMTLGTAQALEPDKNVQLFVTAAQKAGCRSLIQTSLEDHLANSRDRANNIYFIGPTPHHQIFPHCAAVVHHGGSGTTHSATRSGCPSVVVAFTDEQRFWGIVLRGLGVACKPIWYRDATPERLAGGIRSALESPQIRQRAAILGEEMQQEDGISQAVKLIEKVPAR